MRCRGGGIPDNRDDWVVEDAEVVLQQRHRLVRVVPLVGQQTAKEKERLLTVDGVPVGRLVDMGSYRSQGLDAGLWRRWRIMPEQGLGESFPPEPTGKSRHAETIAARRQIAAEIDDLEAIGAGGERGSSRGYGESRRVRSGIPYQSEDRELSAVETDRLCVRIDILDRRRRILACAAVEMQHLQAGRVADAEAAIRDGHVDRAVQPIVEQT